VVNRRVYIVTVLDILPFSFVHDAGNCITQLDTTTYCSVVYFTWSLSEWILKRFSRLTGTVFSFIYLLIFHFSIKLFNNLLHHISHVDDDAAKLNDCYVVSNPLEFAREHGSSTLS
jgi:hypothetical protein